MNKPPELDGFLTNARREFAFLIAEFGFAEMSSARQAAHNPFLVSFATQTTRVEVEGINWGVGVQVILFRVMPSAASPKSVPLWAIARLRNSKLSPEPPPGQLAQLHYYAAQLRAQATDVLRGDFTVFPAAYRLMMKIHKDEVARVSARDTGKGYRE